MNLSTEVEIKSHRPIIGKIIVAYKKIIRLIIGPYLRNVFESENEKDRNIDERLSAIDERLSAIDERLNIVAKDILKRTDALFITLDQRLETLDVRQNNLKEKMLNKEEMEKILNLNKEEMEKRQESFFMILDQNITIIEAALTEVNKKLEGE